MSTSRQFDGHARDPGGATETGTSTKSRWESWAVGDDQDGVDDQAIRQL